MLLWRDSTIGRGKRSAPAAAARRKSSAPRCRGWCWVRLRAKAAHPGGWRRLSRVPQARSSPALPRATILRISMRSASTVVRGKRSAPAAAARRKSSAPRCRGWCWVRLRAKAAHPGGWRRLSRVPQARSSPALPRATILRISMRSASTVVRGKRSAPAAAARRKAAHRAAGVRVWFSSLGGTSGRLAPPFAGAVGSFLACVTARYNSAYINAECCNRSAV